MKRSTQFILYRKKKSCANQESPGRMYFYFNISVNRISVIDSESMDNVYSYYDYGQSYVKLHV